MSGVDARNATRDIQHDLREERWRDDVSRAELLDINATLAALPPTGREDVIASLSDEELARDVGAEQLVRVHEALGVPRRRAELVDAVERHATADVREAFVAGSESPWESEALVERHAQARIEQRAIGRGDRAIEVRGRQIENLIGTSSGAVPRADLPEDADALVARPPSSTRPPARR